MYAGSRYTLRTSQKHSKHDMKFISRIVSFKISSRRHVSIHSRNTQDTQWYSMFCRFPIPFKQSTKKRPLYKIGKSIMLWTKANTSRSINIFQKKKHIFLYRTFAPSKMLFITSQCLLIIIFLFLSPTFLFNFVQVNRSPPTGALDFSLVLSVRTLVCADASTSSSHWRPWWW